MMSKKMGCAQERQKVKSRCRLYKNQTILH